jgi:hypothetical protein
MPHVGRKKNKFSCEVIPLRKARKGGTLTQRVGDASCGAEKTINYVYNAGNV